MLISIYIIRHMGASVIGSHLDEDGRVRKFDAVLAGHLLELLLQSHHAAQVHLSGGGEMMVVMIVMTMMVVVMW